MSQQNVELAHRFYDHFDETGEPLREAVDDGIEIFDHDIPDAGTYQGIVGAGLSE
jgi:hypothetical protein